MGGRWTDVETDMGRGQAIQEIKLIIIKNI